MIYVLAAVIGYAIGNFTASYFVGKGMKNIDIREHGSGNAGATNTLRVLGMKAGTIVFVSDVIKGIVAAHIGIWLIGTPTGGLVAGSFAVIGHNWPLVLNFKGGKGIATTFGLMLILFPEVAGIIIAIFVSVTLLTRYVSLASISCAITFPILLYVFKYPSQIILIGIFLAGLAVLRHKANITKLINGNENKIKFRKK
ncbi:MAG TPA: glycerol-3-phosphate 1-O-acyltransferase PlsY [Bacillota bacterium]|nr:glycerol-3-phosphate 1-O-acyltransferase PlsY [Bacillota bacterium]